MKSQKNVQGYLAKVSVTFIEMRLTLPYPGFLTYPKCEGGGGECPLPLYFLLDVCKMQELETVNIRT